MFIPSIETNITITAAKMMPCYVISLCYLMCYYLFFNRFFYEYINTCLSKLFEILTKKGFNLIALNFIKILKKRRSHFEKVRPINS